jgi:hypothetical protein
MRTDSGKPLKNGGWLHRLNEPLPEIKYVPRPTTPAASAIDWEALHAHWLACTSQESIERLSASLGVSAQSLSRLGAAWTNEHQAFGFPMRSVSGEIVGIRLRTDSGKKFSVRGSKGGLFLPDGAIPDQITLCAVAEGPTDTAAVLDLGYYCVGRQSCSSDVAELVQALRGVDVVILGDRDEDHFRPDGTVYRPGQDGAHALAAALHRTARSVKLVVPLRGKDIRSWKQQGCTAAVLRCVVQNAGEWEPDKKGPKQ